MKHSFFTSFSCKKLFMGLLLSPFYSLVAQEIPKIQTAPVKIDSLYREDQFYLGITYNLLKNAPGGFSNDKFSAGFSAGFLRDMPINPRRNLAVAAGLGFVFNNYSQNIAITQPLENKVYTIMPNPDDYSKNKFSQLLVDLPVEFRWRGSTFENHAFWRLHLGLKMSYLAFDRSVFKGGGNSYIFNSNNDFNKLQYTMYLAGGYGGVNMYVGYGLKPIFKSAQIDGKNIDMRPFTIGLMFYIL